MLSFTSNLSFPERFHEGVRTREELLAKEIDTAETRLDHLDKDDKRRDQMAKTRLDLAQEETRTKEAARKAEEAREALFRFMLRREQQRERRETEEARAKIAAAKAEKKAANYARMETRARLMSLQADVTRMILQATTSLAAHVARHPECEVGLSVILNYESLPAL